MQLLMRYSFVAAMIAENLVFKLGKKTFKPLSVLLEEMLIMNKARKIYSSSISGHTTNSWHDSWHTHRSLCTDMFHISFLYFWCMCPSAHHLKIKY